MGLGINQLAAAIEQIMDPEVNPVVQPIGGEQLSASMAPGINPNIDVVGAAATGAEAALEAARRAPEAGPGMGGM